MRTLFRFPDPVNEVSARLVAGGVVLLCLVILAGMTWLIAVLAYGFVARVATGPTLSPLGQLVTRVVTPWLGLPPRPVAGTPKRFAQGIGAALALSAAALHFVFGLTSVALVVISAIAVAATLESVFGFCLGCWAFARLMAHGMIPARYCAACADITRRPSTATT